MMRGDLFRIRWLGAAACVASAILFVGCPDERLPPDATASSADASATGARAAPSGIVVEVTSVRAEAGIDAEGARAVLREAEPAFLACLDADRSTGVLALKLLIEEDGATLDAETLPATTYGTVDARACFVRIVQALRFPTTKARESFELAITLEVRTRHEAPPQGI